MDERTAELLLERIVELPLRLTDGEDERVAVGVVVVLFTVVEVRVGVATVLLERRGLVADTEALLRVGVLLVRVTVDCERAAVCEVAAVRVVVRTLVLPNVRVAVLREEMRVLPVPMLRVAVVVRMAVARPLSMSRALV